MSEIGEFDAALDALVAKGLGFGHCTHYFAKQSDQLELAQYLEWGTDHRLLSDGTLELADPGIVSKGDDPGAYVLAWLWIADSEFDPNYTEEVEPHVCETALMLVSGHNEPDLDTIEGWSSEQRQLAYDWAMAVHYQASDNDDVVVPPMPEFLK